jgi:hypothetical protein
LLSDLCWSIGQVESRQGSARQVSLTSSEGDPRLTELNQEDSTSLKRMRRKCPLRSWRRVMIRSKEMVLVHMSSIDVMTDPMAMFCSAKFPIVEGESGYMEVAWP